MKNGRMKTRRSVEKFKHQFTTKAVNEFHSEENWPSIDQLFEIGPAINMFNKSDERKAQAVYVVPTYNATRRRRKPIGMSHQ